MIKQRHSTSVALLALILSTNGWILSVHSAEPPPQSTELSASQLYSQQVKPLLKEKCFTCHGALAADSGLRLDAIQLIHQGADSGAVVDTESVESSELLQRVVSDDPSLRMPPEEAGTALTPQQVELLRSWISQGAQGPATEPYVTGPKEHWAFRPITAPGHIPGGVGSGSIDAVLASAHNAAGVTPASLISDELWLRRVYLDLVGTPPSPSDFEQFRGLPPTSRRSSTADRLLASPAYGQRWARHWMDVWRYSDWSGYKEQLRGSQRHIWHWRDWIVDALNDNKPYDRMLIEMLAGDELAPQDPDILKATGFLARNFHNSNRNIWLESTVEHVGKAFLGLTLNCAKCHDHKYDPISQEAYYRFRAIFEPYHVRADRIEGIADQQLATFPRVIDSEPDEPTYLFERGDERRPRKEVAMQPGVPDLLELPFSPREVELPLESYYPAMDQRERERRLQLAAKGTQDARAALQSAIKTSAAISVAVDDADSPQTSSAATSARPGAMQLAAAKFAAAQAAEVSLAARYAAETEKMADGESDRYKQLAIHASEAERRHKHLEASVLCSQLEFDYLKAVETQAKAEASEERNTLAAAQKKLSTAKKALEKARADLDKLLVTQSSLTDGSAYSPLGPVYPRESTGQRLALARWIVHSDNPLTPRVAVNHIWLRHFGEGLASSEFDFGMSGGTPALVELLDLLSSELVRSGWDMKKLHRMIVLSEAYSRASSGLPPEVMTSNRKIDKDNRLFWRGNVRRLDAEQVRDALLAVAEIGDNRFGGPDIDYQQGESVFRRSLYFRHAYEKQMSMLVVFDAASPSECYRRRPSVVPQQALVMANSDIVRTAANQMVANLRTNLSKDQPLSKSSHATLIGKLFQQTHGRQPNTQELRGCIEFIVKQEQLFSQPEQLTDFTGKQASLNRDASATEAAYKSLAVVLLNHNDFVTIR